jgi:hypothetical protein
MPQECCAAEVRRLVEEFLNLLELTAYDGHAVPEVWASFGDWCLNHLVAHRRHHTN